jgi:glutamyl/glutaminyl-tRNA synthetase
MTTRDGRLAPTPTGYLHLGHAATFAEAHRRARAAGARLHLRIEDIDTVRCRPEFAAAAIEDLAWLGLDWDGETVFQSARRALHLDAWRRLRDAGHLYPCRRSRRELAAVSSGVEDPVFPVEWRGDAGEAALHEVPAGVNWRFRVPDGRRIGFRDGKVGEVARVAGVDFSDFLVWNRDDVPSYELAVVVDDIAMGIGEVVRGADLLTSTARQILLYEALGEEPPMWFHCPLVLGTDGRRLAKRAGSLAIRALREAGVSPDGVLGMACRQLDPAG